VWSVVESDPTTSVTVDLHEKVVRAGDVEVTFDIDDYTRRRLIEGLDDIAITLTHDAQISLYEGNRASFMPVTL
jgi:3-isopropylmalate/(R)-2-methylmalate dehydratase small subunit